MRTGRQESSGEAATKGRLTARPAQPGSQALGAPPSRGAQPVGLGGEREALLYVPTGYTPDRPAPLAVMLHGAGGTARHGLGLLQELADSAGLLLLAPWSRRQTWDVIFGSYGPDVAYMDRALEHTFNRYAVDPARLAIGGFSDGASYALSVGITNGDLFTHVIAFSPGFMVPGEQHELPRLYISHGTRDQVLPIDACSRRIVPRVKRAGYDVLYHEFDGPHTVPSDIAREAVDWFIQ